MKKKKILYCVMAYGTTVAFFDDARRAHEFCDRLNAFCQATRDELGGHGLSNIFFVTFA